MSRKLTSTRAWTRPEEMTCPRGCIRSTRERSLFGGTWLPDVTIRMIKSMGECYEMPDPSGFGRVMFGRGPVVAGFSLQPKRFLQELGQPFLFPVANPSVIGHRFSGHILGPPAVGYMSMTIYQLILQNSVHMTNRIVNDHCNDHFICLRMQSIYKRK